jgi:hypothetical protein
MRFLRFSGGAVLMANALMLGAGTPAMAGREAMKLDDIQVVGTHNSYKMAIPAPELDIIRQRDPKNAIELDYAHPPLTEQLDMGLRQIELDVVYDPAGGRYARPLLPDAAKDLPGDTPYDVSTMNAPGLKVMHIPDVDVRSTCAAFVVCLQQIRAWSDRHPAHVPILIILNVKDGNAAVPGGVVPLPFDADAFAALDKEILSVFPAERLVTPDQVRGRHKTLREGVLAGGWPRLSDARGKFLFALDAGSDKVRTYMRGHSSLEGLPIFVNSIDENAPHAAYFTLNEPVKDFARIVADVKAGFVVRTRADAGTREARTNDVGRRAAALASGAQYISTDYPSPRTDFGPYYVRLPKGAIARCNPVRIKGRCVAVGAKTD